MKSIVLSGLLIIGAGASATENVTKHYVSIGGIGEMKMRLQKQNRISDRSEASLGNIYYEHDSPTYILKYKSVLNNVTEKIKSLGSKVVVEGHCDESGSNTYNYHLGLKRAKNVKEALVALGVASENIRVVSYGNKMAMNSKREASKSRRVEIIIDSER